jgi:DNA-binding transcriptional LysR family regulator
MANQQPNWELYRTFLEAARTGSLSAAARRLGISQPAAGRHIEALEKALGIPLFSRTPRGLVPTTAAAALVPHAETMAAASAAFLRAASGEAEAEAGTVRLTASHIIGCEVLPDILAAFHAQHPGIVLELALSNHNEDLLRREADIAVRMVRPTQKSLIAQHIGPVKIGLFAHRSYVERFGLPATPEELPRHCWIGFDQDDHSFRSVGPAPLPVTREMFRFRTDSDAAQMAALRAGVGIGGCQVNIAARNPDLVAVLPQTLMFELEMWLAMHESLKTARRVRLLFSYLANSLSAYVRGPATNG